MLEFSLVSKFLLLLQEKCVACPARFPPPLTITNDLDMFFLAHASGWELWQHCWKGWGGGGEEGKQ